ncbi:MAG TPA: cupin fold metalloprotein, WbuC family [Candidatus Tenderia sp.]|nr:cupin fold metalloprotein, WbuC family [Candidatus Tenderia sp.]
MLNIDDVLLSALQQQAKASPRRRAHRNIHTELSDPVQRLLIAIEPDSYVKPHRHLDAAKWELFLVLKGRIAALIFDEEGRIEKRMMLSTTSGGQLGFEIPPGVWHCVVALEPDTLFFEVKPGPYVQPTDKDFARWAPNEGEAACASFLQWFVGGEVGSEPPV